MIEVVPGVVIHDVQHPQEIEQPPPDGPARQDIASPGIDIKADHPKAYHPAIGDLVQCYIDFPVVPEQIVDDLKVRIDGSALALVAKVNTSKPGIVGSGQYSVFLAPRQTGLTKVVIQPTISGRDDIKPIEITFLVQLERRR